MSQNTTGFGGRGPVDAELVDARLELVVHRAGHREAGEIALDVGEEDRHAELARNLRRAPSATPICRCRSRRRSCRGGCAYLREQVDGLVALADQDLAHALSGSQRMTSAIVAIHRRQRLPQSRPDGNLRRTVTGRIQCRSFRELPSSLSSRRSLLAPQHPRRRTRLPAPKVDDAGINALYARLDQDSKRYENGLALARAGKNDQAEAEVTAALDDLRAAATQCSAVHGCEQQRFVAAFDRLLRLSDRQRGESGIRRRNRRDDARSRCRKPAKARRSSPRCRSSAARSRCSRVASSPT